MTRAYIRSVLGHAEDEKGNLVRHYKEPEPPLSGETLYRRNLEAQKLPAWIVEDRLDEFRRR